MDNWIDLANYGIAVAGLMVVLMDLIMSIFSRYQEPITACGNGIRPDHVRYKPWFIEEVKTHDRPD